MKRGLFIVALLLSMVLATAEEGLADSRFLQIRKWSYPDYTRVVLDLQGAPTYEAPPPVNSPIVILNVPNLSLPRGAQEVSVEDQVIHKIRLEPAGKEGGRAIFFLFQPTRWKVFALEPSLDKPDRLVIDFFKPAVESQGKAEKPISQEGKDQKATPGERAEPSLVVPPPEKVGEQSGMIQELPPRIDKAPPRVSESPGEIMGSLPRIGEPPRAIPPEGPRKKEAVPTKVLGKLLEVRQWAAPDHTRVVIDLDGAPTYEVLPQTDPLTYALSLRGIQLPRGAKEILVGDQVLQKIKVDPAGKEEARLTLFLVRPGRVEVFLLKPYLDKPDRLVVDVSRPDLEEKEKVERQVSRELKAKKKRIIVLDPGHGGEDPGAIGPRGTMEKDVVLALAQGLQKVMDGTGEVRAFLTRRGDYFVPLNERVKIAQEYGADLFISLHANGSRSRQTRGTSIYCLSLKGASDTATQLLAQKENASDLVGGISVVSARKDLDSILLDLEQTHAINESLRLGGIALSELGRVNPIQFSQPRQAGFAVLKAHEFPSILVETAYISHPGEELLLRKKTFQEKLCRAISAAVKNFMTRFAGKEEGPAGGEGEKARRKQGS